tara:strand:+ start:534 stop:1007 length:474 start_codon:yes stop_codon:yes gene_type:complete
LKHVIIITSFGEIISKCKTNNVVNKIKSSNLFHPDENFSIIINHLKSYYSNLINVGIKMPSDVIFLKKIDYKDELDNNKFSTENSILGKLNIFTVNIKFKKIVHSYCDEHSDPLQYIIFNPVTILNETKNDIDNVCAELFISILTTYVSYTTDKNET